MSSQKFDEIIKSLNKKYGDNSIVLLSNDSPLKVEAVSTGISSLDKACGVGGLPRGRMIELFGMESTGKSTLALHIISQIQKKGGKAVFIDAEHAFNPEYAEKVLGVDVNNLFISQPTTAEEAFEIVQKVVASNEVDIVVVDSTAALVPQKELEGEITADHVAIMARMMSQSLRILTSSISRSKTIVIFINQLRDKIGMFYGAKSTTPGGKALKFYSSLRLEVAKGKSLKDKSDNVIGTEMIVRVVKNKVAAPFRSCNLNFYYATGIDTVEDNFQEGLKSGLYIKEGNTYYKVSGSKKEKMGVGENQAVQYLKDNKK